MEAFSILQAIRTIHLECSTDQRQVCKCLRKFSAGLTPEIPSSLQRSWMIAIAQHALEQQSALGQSFQESREPPALALPKQKRANAGGGVADAHGAGCTILLPIVQNVCEDLGCVWMVNSIISPASALVNREAARRDSATNLI
jgi:hypothetical protein